MLTDNRTWGVYSSILSEEGIDFVYSNSASTAYFDLESRKVVVPVWEWMDEYAKQLLVSHEVGHAKFSDYTKEAYAEYTKEFKDLFNVVEDARIERLMKKEYEGLNAIFASGYKVLIKNDIFELPNDFSECSISERLNLYAKIGTQIEIPFFNSEEHKFAYRLMNLNTKADVVSLCYDILEYIKKKKEELPEQSKSSKDFVYSDENKEGAGFGDPSDDEMNKQCESSSEDNSNSSDGSDSSGVNHNNKGNEQEGTDTSANSKEEVEEEIEKELSDKISKKFKENLEEMDEENKDNSINNNKKNYYPPKSLVSISTKDYNDCLFNYAEFMVPFIKPTLTQRYYKTTKKMVENLAKSASNLFKQKMSANENSMIRNRTVGKLDMKKIAKFATSENIFRNIKMLPQGKNHGIVILIDYSSSMDDSYQLNAEFIQACVFGEFCRINNIPFTIYAYGAYISLAQTAIRNGYYKYRKNIMFENSTTILLLGDNNHFDIPSIMWLANKRGVRKQIEFSQNGEDYLFFVSQNGTPTLEALSIAHNKLKEYKNCGIEKTFLYIMTDGMYNQAVKCKQSIEGDGTTDYNMTCSVGDAKNVMLDNKQYSIKQYAKYFSNAFTEFEQYTKEFTDWTFEFFLAHIKKETGATVVYSYVDSYKYMINRTSSEVFKAIHPNVFDGIAYYYSHRTDGIPECYYFYKHFTMFEKGTVNYNRGATFTYNFKNNPFIDQYIFLNTDVIKEMNITNKYATEKVALSEDTAEEYIKNNNAIIKIFEVMVRSFISIFS